MPNFSIRVDPNNRISSYNLVLILEYGTNNVTWTSGFVKSTDQIVTIIIYRIFTWPHSFFFSIIIITTTNGIIYLIIYIIPIYFFNIDVRNSNFSSWNYLINFFTVWTFVLCWLFSLSSSRQCLFPSFKYFFCYHQVNHKHNPP